MNFVCILVGIASGIVLSNIVINPNQIKTDLISAQSQVNSTEKELTECNLKMTGMLMNK